MAKAWKTVKSKEVYSNRFMRVTEDEVRTPKGKKLVYGVVHKKPFAMVIPWTGEYFLMVRQYRYPIKDYTLEFPAGHFEHKTVKATANAELAEEAGVKAKTIKKIGAFNLAPGHHTQECHVFFATGLQKCQTKREDAEEGMEVKKVGVKDLEIMIKSGKVIDGPTIAAFQIMKASNLPK